MSFESGSHEGLKRRKERTMTTTMTELREIDRDEMAGVDGGHGSDDNLGTGTLTNPVLPLPPGWWPYDPSQFHPQPLTEV
jgi:hypothetical protein